MAEGVASVFVPFTWGPKPTLGGCSSVSAPTWKEREGGGLGQSRGKEARPGPAGSSSQRGSAPAVTRFPVLQLARPGPSPRGHA